MNGKTQLQDNLHNLFLIIGSNIQPMIHIPIALRMLKSCSRVISLSQIWETKSEGSDGPNFLNLAVQIQSNLDWQSYKKLHARRIENELHRVRSIDKNAPRTMDIDIILDNNQIIDNALWEQVYIAMPLAQLIPDLTNPKTGMTLFSTAMELKKNSFIQFHSSITLEELK